MSACNSRALIARARSKHEVYLKTVNAELAKISDDDQADRAVTDGERAKWNVPPLADARKRAAEMNARR